MSDTPTPAPPAAPADHESVFRQMLIHVEQALAAGPARSVEFLKSIASLIPAAFRGRLKADVEEVEVVVDAADAVVHEVDQSLS